MISGGWILGPPSESGAENRRLRMPVTRHMPRRKSQRVAAFLVIVIVLAWLVFSRGRLW
jgi:hypothetical protein